MRMMLAEDDPVFQRLLTKTLTKWGFEVLLARDGNQAWQIMQAEDAPRLAVMDWMMPEMDGVEVARRIRRLNRGENRPYLIILTSMDDIEKLVTALEAGADDYITKPFNPPELKARVQVGQRILKLQDNLAQRVDELEVALSRVKTLQGLLPICSYCKKVRNDGNYWQQVESYVSEHSEAIFSHSICPDCYKEYAEPQLKELKERQASQK